MPSPTTQSYRPDFASFAAATLTSKVPGTRTTFVSPPALEIASTQLPSNASENSRLYIAAAMPKRRPVALELVSQLCSFRFKILFVVRCRLGFDWQLLDDLQTEAFEADDFLGIVREQPDTAQAEVAKNLRAKSVLAKVRLEAELLVCFD